MYFIFEPSYIYIIFILLPLSYFKILHVIIKYNIYIYIHWPISTKNLIQVNEYYLIVKIIRIKNEEKGIGASFNNLSCLNIINMN